MKSIFFSAALLLSLIPFSASAEGIHTKLGSEPCWDAAAKYHGLDPWLLYSVAYVESRHNASVVSGKNRNGTYDIGLMQINSIWLPELRRYGISESTLKNGCASTYVGAWIMAKNIRRYGYTWQAIASYNVGSVETRNRRVIGYGYAKKVYDAYHLLTIKNRQNYKVATK